jgi:GNAT superfamily N-acetyltransferase
VTREACRVWSPMSPTCVSTDQPPTIRQVQIKDWAVVRDTIIEMLTEAPNAFGETLAEAQACSPIEWQARVQCWAEGMEEVAFIASNASGICGFVRGDYKDPRTRPYKMVLVKQLWTAPRQRGRGLGRKLMQAVTKWAAEVNAVRIVLGVMEPNPEVVKFYEHLGYRKGRRECVSDTDRREYIVMLKELCV